MRRLVLVWLFMAGAFADLWGAPVPDFNLFDTNLSSPRRNTAVSPRDYQQQISAFYFAHADCSYCSEQFGFLNQLQAELRATNTDFNIEIAGVNDASKAAFNAVITSGRTIPWLQDTATDNVWTRWQVGYRDLRVLDSQNQLLAVYNLTEHNLSDPSNRAALTQLLLDAARRQDSDHDGLPDDWETRFFGNLAAGPADDPDGDGWDNLLEFAFGTDPKTPTAASSLGPNAVRTRQSSQLTISFHRRLGSLITYTVETSNDLSQWNPAVPEAISILAPRNLFDGTGTAEVVCFPSRAAFAAGPQFVRVRAALR